ncbi:MAG: DUF971 domain-containing protein [Paraburkholderia sp.]
MSTPQQIASDAVARTLTLQWSDGRERQIAHAQLRQACACAECRRIRLDGGTVQAPPDVTLTDVQPMGYGVQLVFSDGHARGIYPWRYLEELAEAGSSQTD